MSGLELPVCPNAYIFVKKLSCLRAKVALVALGAKGIIFNNQQIELLMG